jgi:replicative DNA helicase
MARTPRTDSPPQSTDVEASLLGSLLIDNDAFIKIGDLIQADDFFDDKHRMIFAAMKSLHDKRSPIDILMLSEQLKGDGRLELIGGASFLTELTNTVPTAAHLEQYAEVVAEKAIRRRLIMASEDIATVSLDENKSLQELIEEAETRLFDVSQKHVKQDITSLESILGESFDRLDDLHRNKGGIRGIPTGLRDLDKLIAGLQRSDLIVVAARPSMGKTALHHQHPLAVIMVDYLQLMSGGSRYAAQANRVQEISEISRSLKILARELNVPVVAASQLSRSVESRNPPIPQLADLRESGAIEQDADIVTFIYRPHYYDDSADPNVTELHIKKHRNGPVDNLKIFFDRDKQRFRDLDTRHQQPFD